MSEPIYKIDIYSLETELAMQPHNHKIVSDRYADAVFERDTRKVELEKVKADVYLDVQSNYANYGLDKKPTGAITDACVDSSEKVLKASEDLRESVRNMNKALASKEASDHKKKALEGEVSLFLSNYYAEPYIPKGEQNTLEKRTEENVKAKVNRNLKRKGERNNG